MLGNAARSRKRNLELLAVPAVPLGRFRVAAGPRATVGDAQRQPPGLPTGRVFYV